MADLPPIEQVSEDYPVHLARLKQDYEQATGTYPLPAHPETFLLEQLAYEMNLARQLINHESRQNLLAEAQAERLNYLGDLLTTPRLPAQPALTQLQFTLSPAHPGLTIPVGTQVRAADGNTLFATTRAETVLAGQTQAVVTAACTETGLGGNGFTAGEVNQLTSQAEHIIRTQNLIVTAGGSEPEGD
ncbi:MAG: baseplate J/gp47 family protein, partial [Pseudomonadota bacterium]